MIQYWALDEYFDTTNHEKHDAVKSLPRCRLNFQLTVSDTESTQYAVQSRKAVAAYFSSEQVQPFGFAEQGWLSGRR